MSVHVPVVCDRRLPFPMGFGRASTSTWLVRQRGSWVDLYSHLQWPLLWDAECLTCDCWMESAWEAPWLSASPMAVEQWVSASLIAWTQLASASLIVRVQLASASLMDSVVSDSLCWRVIPKSATSFCWLASIKDLVTSKSPPGDGQCLREGHCFWALGFWL